MARFSVTPSQPREERGRYGTGWEWRNGGMGESLTILRIYARILWIIRRMEGAVRALCGFCGEQKNVGFMHGYMGGRMKVKR